MSGIRHDISPLKPCATSHDRSVIEAFGGIWPKLADAVREDSMAIAQDLALPVREVAPRCEVEVENTK